MTKFWVEIKYAVFFVLMTLSWVKLEEYLGLHDRYISFHAIYTNLIALPAIAIYVLALLEKRKKFYLGTMTYLEGFKSGLIVTGTIAFLSPFAQFLTSIYITPNYFQNVISYSIENNLMSIEVAKGYFNLNNYIVQAFIGAVVMGSITSSIVAYFVRKK